MLFINALFSSRLHVDDYEYVSMKVNPGCSTNAAQSASVHCTGCSLNIVFFLKMLRFFWTLSVLLQRWCSTCLVCVHTLAPSENRVRSISKSSEKNTIFNEHPVYKMWMFWGNVEAAMMMTPLLAEWIHILFFNLSFHVRICKTPTSYCALHTSFHFVFPQNLKIVL